MDPIFEADLNWMKQTEREKTDAIRKFLHYWRKGYPEPVGELRRDLGPTGTHDWLALSASARTEVAKLIFEDLSRVSKVERKALSRVSSLLFTSNDWCLPLERAGEISFEAIRNEINRTLTGQNYVGTIEPGLYRDRKMPGASERGVVSWHAHLIWLGNDVQSLDRAIETFTDKHEGPLVGVPSANPKPRSWKTLGDRITYMLKTPAKSYTTRYESQHVDRRTGEISGRDRQSSKKLRPGEQVKLLNLFAEVYLDDLMIVGGKGWEWVSSLQAAILRNRAGWMERYGDDEGLRGGLVRNVPELPPTHNAA